MGGASGGREEGQSLGGAGRVAEGLEVEIDGWDTDKGKALQVIC
jgi:hypothetical protein